MNSQRLYLVLALFYFQLITANDGHALNDPLPAISNEDHQQAQVAPSSERSSSVTLFPLGSPYPTYIADPHSVDFSFQYLNFTRKTIPESGDKRFNLKLGGRFGLIRFVPSGTDWEYQLEILGGFVGQFDLDNSLDNIGWDGKYGLLATTAKTDGPAFKFGAQHTSSHVGDEYEERTGRRRIGYTRNEFVGAVSWPLYRHWRIYAEAGYAYNLGNIDLQKTWRWQSGVEYESRKTLLNNTAGWYAAVDLSSMQERDWRVDNSIQAGFMIKSRERRWRFGIERYSGRPPIGEFFQYTESYIALGFWIDI